MARTSGRQIGGMNIWTMGDCKVCKNCPRIIFRYQTSMRNLNYEAEKYCDEFCKAEGRSRSYKETLLSKNKNICTQ